MRRLLLLALVESVLLLAGSTGSAGEGGQESSLVPWVASDSWPGGAQYDARLETSVQFWGAGMPLKQVFEGVREQTGVEIGFWPAGDDNERICVNLYLNPEKPPTLRELMAQLSWVLDCGFGVAHGADEEPTYALLETSMAGGALARLEGERKANSEAVRARSAERWAENSRKLAEKLPELRNSLVLSRKDLIERYKGVDDRVLLAMLDPRRRALVELVLGLDEADLNRLLQEWQLRRNWGEWSSSERAALSELLAEDLKNLQMVEEARRPWLQNWDWGEDAPLEIIIFGPRAGVLHVRGGIAVEEKGSRTTLGVDGASVSVVGQVDDDRPWHPKFAIELRELLGEKVTPGEREALHREWQEIAEARSRARRQERMREGLERRLAAQCPLTPETKGVLSSFAVPQAFSDEWPLWRLQEVVAAESGMHVVSDCFWQPRRDLWEVVELLCPEERPELSALLALRLSALSTLDTDTLLDSSVNDDRVGWEWEDAGEFLRFRHLARDLWRAAFLPQDRLREMDEWLSPYVTEAVESGRDEISVAVSVDIREASRIARQLDDFQVYHGGRITYGDPKDVEQAYLQALREEVLAGISPWEDWYRLLGTCTEHQWEKLFGPGLSLPEDLTPDQQARQLPRSAVWMLEGTQRYQVRLTEGEYTWARGRGQPPEAKDSYVIEFLPRDPAPQVHTLPLVWLPRTIVVELKRPAESGGAAPASTGPEQR